MKIVSRSNVMANGSRLRVPFSPYPGLTSLAPQAQYTPRFSAGFKDLVPVLKQFWQRWIQPVEGTLSQAESLQGERAGKAVIYKGYSRQPVEALIMKTPWKTSEKETQEFDEFTLYVGKRKVGFLRVTDYQGKNSLRVSQLASQDSKMAPIQPHPYKGVGQALLQIAVEASIQKGYNGHVHLYPALGSRGFYEKLGFVDVPSRFPNWDPDVMMSEEGLAQWRTRIEQQQMLQF